ncbi:DUF4062 domain-containing protein [Methylocystis sp. H4A]|uniref:DUF4062 domain-containing protein n=1 Tax=Methylocystis sp. H4A TaxID=2785788 RepID=UPI0018C294CC|nr:DUF4062 domain-containing protein [Methylocystis sp. H4A]MBG0802212.1 DUF4062 domain-containing protein [Methylocystis sp. H4A]
MFKHFYWLVVFWFRKALWVLSGRPRLSRQDVDVMDDRTIRLFVSSTFVDMQEERLLLQEDVFPIVRRHLWERGVNFVYIDLRWGVTREEAQAGEVLRICLREIDRCRPWILGMLSNRYGWVDPKTHERLSAEPRFGRLLDHSRASVTELELRHAITNRPVDSPAPAALLYWRVAPAPDTPFASLVSDLENSGAPVKSAPADLRAFADILRDELIALVDARLPRRPALPLAQFLARARTEERRNGFVMRREVKTLVRLAAGSAGRYALVGPDGCGKSAVMAAAVRALEAEGRVKCVAAFAPGGFRNWTGAFKSVLEQLGDSGHGKAGGPASLTRRFHDAVKAASALSPLCIFIDDVAAAAGDDLAWLPEFIPNTVIVVALRGGTREAALAGSHGYASVDIGPPDARLAQEMIERYLLAYARRLDEPQLAQLLSKRRSARGYLIAGEELRQTQRFEDLDASVSELGTLGDDEALARRALARILDGRPWAKEVILAVAVSEMGIPDETLCQLAQTSGGTGRQIDISLLREAVGEYATNNAGRLLFVNDVFRRIILDAGSDDDRVRMRLAIIDVSLSQVEVPGAALEILSQAEAIGDWPRLAVFLARSDLAAALMRSNPEAFAAAWSNLSAHHHSSPEQVYGAWIGVEPPDRVALAAEYLSLRSAAQVVERLAQDALARRDAGDAATRVRALLVLARFAETAGRLDDATDHCREIERMANAAGNDALRALVAANTLRLDFLKGGAAAVTRRVDETRERARNSPDGRALATVLLVEGLAALDVGDLRKARAHFARVKQISLRDDDFAGGAAAEAGLARADLLRGYRKSAEEKAQSVVAVGELLGDNRLILEGLAIRTAVATDDAARFADAREIIASRRRIAEEMNDQIALIEADMDEAILFAGKSALADAAFRLAESALRRSRALGLTRLERKIVGVLKA